MAFSLSPDSFESFKRELPEWANFTNFLWDCSRHSLICGIRVKEFSTLREPWIVSSLLLVAPRNPGESSRGNDIYNKFSVSPCLRG